MTQVSAPAQHEEQTSSAALFFALAVIAAGTIEEKILKLHQTKKSMADALLEGGDVSASMSRDEIIALLKDTYSF